MKIIVADRYMTLDSVKPDKDCTQGCDIHNDYTCFECEDIQIRKVYPNRHNGRQYETCSV